MSEEKLTAENYATDWLNAKYRGAKELGDWTPQDVFQFAEDFANARASAWIPVSKRLPNVEQGLFLVTIDYGTETPNLGTATVLFDANNWWWFFDTDELKPILSKVVAWQPLPEPYQETTTAN